MSHTASIPPSSPGSAAPEVARLQRCWPYVHVVSANVVDHPAGRHAHAVVQLAGLAPADVRIELMRLPAASPPSAPATEEPLRMWSCQSYENGCFVFETALPREDAARGEWLIHIHAPTPLSVPPVRFRWAPEPAHPDPPSS